MVLEPLLEMVVLLLAPGPFTVNPIPAGLVIAIAALAVERALVMVAPLPRLKVGVVIVSPPTAPVPALIFGVPVTDIVAPAVLVVQANDAAANEL